MPWIRDPDRGGVIIPKSVQTRTRQRILTYAEKNYSGKFMRIDVRFRGHFCYIDGNYSIMAGNRAAIMPHTLRCE